MVTALHKSEGVDDMTTDGVQIGGGPDGHVDAELSELLLPALLPVYHDDQIRHDAHRRECEVGGSL